MALRNSFLILLLATTSLYANAMGKRLPNSSEVPISIPDKDTPARFASTCPQLASLADKARLQSQLNIDSHVDLIIVDKSRRLLHLMESGEVIKSYRVALGKTPSGKKQCSGDNRTPEGQYSIGYKNYNSEYHLSLNIDYPRHEDLQRANKLGCNPGGDIMIHGLPEEKLKRAFIRHPSDWTRGCLAVKDHEIEEIFSVIGEGTDIEICK
jgi:murein L,D-transpeptidase YafK